LGLGRKKAGIKIDVTRGENPPGRMMVIRTKSALSKRNVNAKQRRLTRLHQPVPKDKNRGIARLRKKFRNQDDRGGHKRTHGKK